ncbi:unnamed protein product [Didymodactylos carnosus]|uniref:Uncharacterized protein n=1 Tax=Didymodactylos carnosus TaxID=1234261 RepID=A0A815DTT7_9BILA|nr:unnamed protein product [Didymodactylos carnosus]CAF1305951.1 unnamed protein product [Didymodactylos carnosus]CAF3644937.1 unnamed protein product [Didymodactylos carnosus]CAF4139341.1 unnamed protein product [Didymodactylos carnosus]
MDNQQGSTGSLPAIEINQAKLSHEAATDTLSQGSNVYEQQNHSASEYGQHFNQIYAPRRTDVKLLGLSCGTEDGNSEILLKEALMGAEELGVTVELLRVDDLSIPSSSIPVSQRALTDDGSWFLEKRRRLQNRAEEDERGWRSTVCEHHHR